MAEQYQNPDVEYAVRRTSASLERAFSGIQSDLERQLAALDRDGQVITRSPDNVRRVQRMAQEMQRQLRDAGYSEALQRQTEEMRRLAAAVLEEAGDKGIPQRFSETTGQSVQAILSNAHRELIRDEAKVAGDLEDLIVRSTMGSTEWMDIVSSLEEQLDLRQRQAITKASSTLSQFHTTTRVQHFADAGVRWWLYEGPRDDRNRDWCGHFVDTRVTVDILNQHASSFGRKHPLPPSISLGGYNCRHELIPLVEPSAIRRHPIGPRSLAAAA